MARLSMWFLGGFRVCLDGGPETELRYNKVRALLAYLALESQRPHRREALAGLLWPELSERRARNNLSQALYVLRSALEGTGRPCLLVTAQAVQFDPAGDCWLDVCVFTSLLSACQAHVHWQLETCPACGERLACAAALYAGPFLHGLSLADSPAFEEWQLVQREHLHQLAVDALAALAKGYEARGDVEQALEAARRWVELEPWHEAAHRLAMRALALSGRRNAALAQYEACRRALAEELGIEPAAATVALYEQIRGSSETGLLKAPQVTETRFLDRKHNLPAPVTPFVGQEKTLAELTALLQDSGCRLVTLVGPGGIGKTRLALQLAEEAMAQASGDRFPDGVYFVPLAPVHTVDGAVSAVVQALGLSLPGSNEPRQQLLRTLRDRRILLVLDNVEQLIANGGEDGGGRRRGEGVELLLELLRVAPGVQLLVTSRARLNASGEQVLAVPGLDVPPPDLILKFCTKFGGSVLAYSGVRLYLQQARRARPGYEPDEEALAQIGRICRMVEGMPLAIVLAAAWSDVLSPSEIAAELGRSLAFLHSELFDLPERHRSMVAAFDVSWAMLSEAERQAFAMLSVFRGGFTREAAQQVAGADLETLRGLAHKLFLTCDERGRYQVHELLRQYGEKKLEERPAEMECALDRHGAWYAGFLARQETDIWRGNLAASLCEIDNIRAAWRWVTANRRVAQIHPCLSSLWILYQGSFLGQEGEAIFAEAVTALRPRPGERAGEEQTAARGLALVMQGYFAAWFDHMDRAIDYVEQGLSLLHRVGKGSDIAVGNVVAVSGVLDLVNMPRARQLLEESLALSRKLDLKPVTILALYNLAYNLVFAALQADYVAAEQYAREALAVARQIDDRYGAALALTMLGHIFYARADYIQARQTYQKGLELFQQTGHLWAVGRLYSHLGDVAMAVHDDEAAQDYHRRALTRYQDLGFYWVEVLSLIGGCYGVPVSLQRLGDAALACGDLPEARRQYGLALAAASDRLEVGLKPHVLLGPAAFLAQTGDQARAVEVTAMARYHPESVEETRVRADELLHGLQARLSPEPYAVAEARGRARDLEATLRELLEELAHDTGVHG
ncbi:MAG: AAA family ATPase [Anaerolineae bacterium]|nr:AAA family ATPase [Anaerolineae bacterium]